MENKGKSKMNNKAEIDRSHQFYIMIFSILIIVSLLMMFLYFRNFNGNLSDDSNDWGNFGSYLGPITNIFTMSILIITLFLQNKDNSINIKRINKHHDQNIKNLNNQILIAEKRVELFKIEKEIELYTVFITAMNNYLFEVTKICMNFLRINRLYFVLKKEKIGNEPSIYNDDNFYNKIQTVKIVMEEIKGLFKNKKILEFNEQRYYERFLQSCEELLDFDLFIKITEKMQIESVGYIYFLGEEFQDFYNRMVIEIEQSTTANMEGFSILQFKEKIEEYNKKIISHISSLRKEIKYN